MTPPVGPLASRFSRHSALRSEWIYGEGYQGPSSEDLFEEFAARLPIRPGMRILEIGSGLGGDAFRLATRHGAEVVGVDASPDMTQLSRERAEARGITGVRFEAGDVRTLDLEESAFDLVWTRDCFMYLPPDDKRTAWQRLHQVLRPNGRILVTDYCRGATTCSPEFEALHHQSDFHLITQADYVSMLESAGFTDLEADDRTHILATSQEEERDRMLAERTDFLARFTVEEYENLLSRWDTKITLSRDHELTWLVLTARVG